ncbi:MAG: hypothetical protein GX543_05660 [Gordonia sp.]|nr:hypothetical protein [Gordonia sp. (in: high G+C Gram-positive bacteria)]
MRPPENQSPRGPSSAEGFVALIAVCRELGLTSIDDETVRRPHRRVDEFRHAHFSSDALRLTRLAESLAQAADVDGVGETSVAEWSGRAGRAAGGALRVVGDELAGLRARLDAGAEATAQADAILREVLGRHRGVLATVSRPRLAGYDLEALPAALNSGALSPHSLRGEVQARLDYAESAGVLAGDAIAGVAAEVATAWSVGAGSADAGSAGELILADLQ